MEVLIKDAKEPRMPANTLSRVRDGSLSNVSALPDEIGEDLVLFFKLFADETRLQILHFLMQQDELNVRTLCEMLGQSQPAVSHHLAMLRVAGLIACRREGKHNYYGIISERFQEFVEMMFSVVPKQSDRIAFETFSLSYRPAGE